MCVYYAQLIDSKEDPAIEDHLNHFYIKNLNDLQKLIEVDSNYQIVVRTVKTILQEPDINIVTNFLSKISDSLLRNVYYSCLSEGYYQNPAFSTNFAIIRNIFFKSK